MTAEGLCSLFANIQVISKRSHVELQKGTLVLDEKYSFIRLASVRPLFFYIGTLVLQSLRLCDILYEVYESGGSKRLIPSAVNKMLEEGITYLPSCYYLPLLRYPVVSVTGPGGLAQD